MAEESSDHLDLDLDLSDSDKDPEFVPKTKKKEKQKQQYNLVSIVKSRPRSKSSLKHHIEIFVKNTLFKIIKFPLLPAEQNCVQIAWKSIY